MDFDQAVVAHGAWKNKLVEYLTKRDGSLKPADLFVDNKCSLGQWIHGEGMKYSKFPEFAAPRDEHARFHKAVAEVVRHADEGKSITAETALGARSEFSSASSAVVLAIVNMKKHAADS